jgi:hypothetical protein
MTSIHVHHPTDAKIVFIEWWAGQNSTTGAGMGGRSKPHSENDCLGCLFDLGLKGLGVRIAP